MLIPLFVTVVIGTCVNALGVFVPLYSNPDYNCSNWSPVSSSIAAHPDTPFYLVVWAPQDNDTFYEYDQCVPSLRPAVNPNTVVLGYVDTRLADVEIFGQIDNYANWSSSSRPTGIFLHDTNASSATVYQQFISHAKGKGFPFIILAPFQPPSSDYYALGDLVVTYGNSYGTFLTTSLEITPSTPATKQIVWLTTAPSNGSYSAKLSELTTAGIAAVFITDGVKGWRIPYNLPMFVNEVASIEFQRGLRIKNQNEALSSSHTSIIVGGVLGTVIAALALVLYLIWLRQRQHAPLHNSPVHPFRYLQHANLARLFKKPSHGGRQNPPEEQTGLTQQANPLRSEATRKRGFKIIEYLSPSEARRAFGRSRTSPPVYSTL